MVNHDIVSALHQWTCDAFDYVDWKKFGTEFDCIDDIESDENFERSMHNKDEYYSNRVYQFFEYICTDSDFVKRVMNHEPFVKWLKEVDLNLYNKIYENVSIVIDDLKNMPQLDKEITRIKKALIDDDSEPVIGHTKDLLEKIFKMILDDYSEEYNNSDNMPTLYKKTCHVLKLDLNDNYNNSFKKILGSCSTIVNEICSLRNKFGTGHGNPKSISISRGHQMLFINSAATICTFLIYNWKKNKR